MSAVDFAELSRNSVERFIQTVLVIDNELTLDDTPDPPATPLIEPRGGLRDTTRPKPEVALPIPGEPSPVAKSPLDAKQIMDAFLRHSMICGMHKPNGGTELVQEAINAARRSDAVIVDWMLDGSDPSAAKRIVAGILEDDAKEKGRLRLVAIYTSEQDITGVARQIREHLGDPAIREVDVGALAKPQVRIVVLNKDGTVGAERPVKIAELPGRIVEEFTHLSPGILGTFAVSAVAAVRRETHHVLAIFSEELDGAFLGHMCALKSPDDAREFALDLLGGELRNVASMNAATSDLLSPANLALRIDGLARAGILSMGDVKVPVGLAREFPSGGRDGVVASLGSQRRERNGRDEVPPKKEGVNPENVGYLFHSGAGTADEAHRRFARFACFRTEPFDRTVLPAAWTPSLTLGTVVVRIAEDGAVDPAGYFLCTQPRCDAVRLEFGRNFPFQAVFVAEEGAAFNLVAAIPAQDGKKETVLLSVGSKPHDTRMIEFSPTEGGRVRATKTSEVRYEFVDVRGKRYLWIGDLRDLAAQRTASAVAARMHEVGLDEYEWLRIKAGKADR